MRLKQPTQHPALSDVIHYGIQPVVGLLSVHTCCEERVLLHVIHYVPIIAITVLVLHCLQCIASLYES